MKKLLLFLSILLTGSTALAFTQVRQVQISTGNLSRQSGWFNVQAGTVTTLDAPNIFSTNTVVAASATIQGGFIGGMTSSGTWTLNAPTFNGTSVNNSTITFTGKVSGSNGNDSTINYIGAVFNGSAQDNSTVTYTATKTFRNTVQVSTGMATPATFSVNPSSVVVGASGSPAAVFGTQTNNDAATGFYGEYISSISANTPMSGTGQYFTVGGSSVILTAGDWQIDGVCYFTRNAATYSSTALECGIGTADGNSSTGMTLGDTETNIDAGTVSNTFSSFSMLSPLVRKSISTTSTFYLKAFAGAFTGTPLARGRISARRIR